MTKQVMPHHRQQAIDLLKTGKCDLPVDWNDIAHKVSRMDNFPYALQQFYLGQVEDKPSKFRLLEMMVITAAHTLCQEQDNAS